jgi:MFS family permease
VVLNIVTNMINLQVFSSVGAAGAVYAYVIVAVDTTSLRNRGIAFAFTSSPYMITAFAGPRAAQAFELNVGSWRWAFGTFAIITPFMAIPLFTMLKVNLNKAKKAGLMPAEAISSGRTFSQTLRHIAVEFDSKSTHSSILSIKTNTNDPI